MSQVKTLINQSLV